MKKKNLWSIFFFFEQLAISVIVCLSGHYRHVPEKAMAPHSSTLAWKLPWTEEPGGLQSMGSLRVRHVHPSSYTYNTFSNILEKDNPCKAQEPLHYCISLYSNLKWFLVVL